MSDILQRLQGKTELCKALGVRFGRDESRLEVLWTCTPLDASKVNPPVEIEVEHSDFGRKTFFTWYVVYLDNDDCPGSALLVSRCLDWLKAEKQNPSLSEGSEPDTWMVIFGPILLFEEAPTRVLAALTAVLEVEEGK